MKIGKSVGRYMRFLDFDRDMLDHAAISITTIPHSLPHHAQGCGFMDGRTTEDREERSVFFPWPSPHPRMRWCSNRLLSFIFFLEQKRTMSFPFSCSLAHSCINDVPDTVSLLLAAGRRQSEYEVVLGSRCARGLAEKLVVVCDGFCSSEGLVQKDFLLDFRTAL
jgi:hypothetical protein